MTSKVVGNKGNTKYGKASNCTDKSTGSGWKSHTGTADWSGSGPAWCEYRQFVSQFNERTKNFDGMVVPAVITVYADRTFDFIIKSPPAAVLLKDAASVAKGAGNPLKDKVGKVTKAQVKKIAETKMNDLNASDLDHAVRVIEGTARSMGIEVEN